MGSTPHFHLHLHSDHWRFPIYLFHNLPSMLLLGNWKWINPPTLPVNGEALSTVILAYAQLKPHATGVEVFHFGKMVVFFHLVTLLWFLIPIYIFLTLIDLCSPIFYLALPIICTIVNPNSDHACGFPILFNWEKCVNWSDIYILNMGTLRWKMWINREFPFTLHES